MTGKPLKSFLVVVFCLTTGIASAELTITGLEPDVEQNVRVFVALANEPCDAPDWLVRRRLRAAPDEAREALEPFGYYEPVISSELVFDDECWRATLTIDAGEPVLYRSVEFSIDGEASTDAAFDDLTANLALVPGEPLRHADYERLKRALQVRAADRGYVEARFVESSIEVVPADKAADITLTFDSGPRYRMGEIIVEQALLEPEIVGGYLDLQRGTYFEASKLTEAHGDLSDSAYFGDIQVTADIENAADGEIPIRISLGPGTRIEYTIGVGASTDTSVRFRAGFRNNRINSRGHRLIADVNASAVIQSLTAEYRIPLSDPRKEWFSFTGALSNEDTDTFDNEAQRVGLRWSKAMSDTWIRTLSLDASNESFNVGEDVDTSRLVVPGVSFDQKISDRDVFPTRGRRLGMELRGTDEVIGSTTSYLQATIWARWIKSFGDGNRLLARLNAGVTSSKNFSRLPPSVRFFAGGDDSVRGYDYNTLGPTDAEDNVIGGTNLLVASLEYERHLTGNFFGAAFVDAGNAFDDVDFDPEVGAGLGLKWRSPLGPLRFYLGYPVTADNKSVRFHLRLGADL